MTVESIADIHSHLNELVVTVSLLTANRVKLLLATFLIAFKCEPTITSEIIQADIYFELPQIVHILLSFSNGYLQDFWSY